MSSFFESLYSQFLLRDLVAKVVPGLVSIMALAFQKAPKLSDATIRQRERFAILKEMAGNFGMALLVSAIALFIGAFTPILYPSLGLICLIPLAIAVSVILFRQSIYHADEQLLWESKTLGKKP